MQCYADRQVTYVYFAYAAIQQIRQRLTSRLNRPENTMMAQLCFSSLNLTGSAATSHTQHVLANTEDLSNLFPFLHPDNMMA